MRSRGSTAAREAAQDDEFSASPKPELNNPSQAGGAVAGCGVEEGGSPFAFSVTASANRLGSRSNAPRAGGPLGWPQRCESLFQSLRRPARAMVARAYGRALSDDELDDVYSAAWTATLSALRNRGESMSDDELRAYVLTAVASHASKELRRRSRKPAGPLEDSHEQVIFDVHSPLPDERAVGSESRSVARDLLMSLPARRRAVMLLRYGWGLSPGEVCALVSGLSPRAYRKEVTKGVEQLIDRLKQVESGEWCETREPILRDYVAGTAGREAQIQAIQHLHHCRACSDFVARLSGHLHDLGASVALASAASSIGPPKLPIVERITQVFDRGKEVASSAAERAESSVASVAGSGGSRGAGAAGAGVLAKVAGLGAAGKAAAVCMGAGVAATACVAAGVVPGVSLSGGSDEAGRERRPAKERPAAPLAATPTPSPDSIIGDEAQPVSQDPMPAGEAGPHDSETGGGDAGGEEDQAPVDEPAPAPAPAPVGSTAPTAAPEEQEFGLPSSTAVAPAPSSGDGSSTSSGDGTSEGSGASGTEIQQEFGP